jgi:hypothetical protein
MMAETDDSFSTALILGATVYVDGRIPKDVFDCDTVP